MRSDNHVRPEDRGGLHNAVYDAGHQHTVRETGKKEAAAVLVPEPAIVQRVDVYSHRVPGRLAVSVHVGQVRVATANDRGPPSRARSLHRGHCPARSKVVSRQYCSKHELLSLKHHRVRIDRVVWTDNSS